MCQNDMHHWGVCGVCVGGGWFTASPGLSQTDWTLAGWGCTPVVHESNHGTQDKPAINTHTRGGATGTAVCTISSANTTSLNLPLNILYERLPVSCVGGPQGKPLRWRVEGEPCHNHQCGVMRFSTVCRGRDRRGRGSQ